MARKKKKGRSRPAEKARQTPLSGKPGKRAARKPEQERPEIQLEAPRTAAAGPGAQEQRRPAAAALLSSELVWIAVGLCALYTVVFSYFSLVQHQELRTQLDDLGNAMQAIWAASQGDLRMVVSNENSGVLRSRLAIHVNLFYWLIAPIYRVFPYPATLLILTSVACGAAGLGLFFLARRRLGETWWALVPAVAYWLSPIVQDANLYDFHIITITAALLIWTVYAFDAGNRLAAWILFGAALLCKEDVALVTAMMGIWLWLSGERRDGLIAIGVSAAYFLLALFVIVPLVDDSPDMTLLTGASSRYRWLGDSVPEMLQTVVTEPGRVIRHLMRGDHIRIFIYLLLCGGVAGLRAWPLLLLAVPPLAVGMLSRTAWMTRVTGTYYWITAEAAVVLACVFAASYNHTRVRTANRRQNRPPDRTSKRRPWQLIYLGTATLLASVALSPLPYGVFAYWENYAPTPGSELIPEISAKIPVDARLCVQNNLGPHFAHRPDVAQKDIRCASADTHLYHIRYVGGPRSGLFVRTSTVLYGRMNKVNRRIQQLISSPEWGLTYQKEGFYLFEKGAPSIMSREEMKARYNEDRALFARQYKQAREFETPLLRYLSGTFK